MSRDSVWVVCLTDSLIKVSIVDHPDRSPLHQAMEDAMLSQEDMEELIKGVRRTEYKKRQHLKIQEYIKANLGKFPIHLPPVHILAYTIRRILRPIKWHLIPDLLNLLANVELIRRKVAECASTALTWHNVFTAQGGSLDENGEQVRLLKSDEVKALDEIANSDVCEEMKVQWHAASLNIRSHHIHHILLTDALPDFKIYYPLYFPPSIGDYPSPPLFLECLSGEEREAERLFLEKAKLEDMPERVSTWRDKRRSWWLERWPEVLDDILYGETPYTSIQRDFQKTFPSQIEWSNLVGVIERWLTKVQSSMDTLEHIFPLPKPGLGTKSLNDQNK
ncbi:hypothetical protein FRC02_004815, partial [Tulasnella sp. 418]